jgi:cytochrome c oxidase subunit 4
MSAHIASKSLYYTIFLALLALTGLTVGVTYVDLGQANLFVALAIALTKATLVGLFFMHLRWSSRLVHVAVIAAFAFLAILAMFTFGDYVSRGWLGVAGK